MEERPDAEPPDEDLDLDEVLRRFEQGTVARLDRIEKMLERLIDGRKGIEWEE